MADRISPCVVVVSGPARDVAFFVAANGHCQVDAYLRDPNRARESKKFYMMARKLADSGWISNEQQFRHERGGVWGLKLANQIRVACFLDGRLWVCTHAFQKNGPWRREDLDRADAIRQEYLLRKV